MFAGLLLPPPVAAPARDVRQPLIGRFPTVLPKAVAALHTFDDFEVCCRPDVGGRI